MSDWKKKLDEEFSHLKQKRDELRVQIDLGKKEMRSAWGDLDEKWDGLERQMQRVRDEAKHVGEDVSVAARALIDEIRDGFKRIRDSA